MSYRTSRRRVVAPALASLALGLAALGGVPAARASTPAPSPFTLPTDPAAFVHMLFHPSFDIAAHLPQQSLSNGSNAQPESAQPKSAVSHTLAIQSHVAISPAAVSGSGVVTNCSTAGYNAAGGAQGIGLGYAVAHFATITFACNAALGAPFTSSGVFLITVPSTIVVTGAQSIDGSDGGKNDVAILGGLLSNTTPTTRIFMVDNGASLSLANLSLALGLAPTNLDGYGGAVASFGTFSANNVTFAGNSAYNGGGALELATDPTTSTTVDTITNCTFLENTAENASGGAIDINTPGSKGSQSVAITTSTFLGNQAPNDSAGAIYSNNSGATVAIGRALFAFNQAGDGPGGAISNVGSTFSVASSEFIVNQATDDAGAINEDSGQTMTITGSSFLSNQTGDDGGAFDSNDGGSISSITNSTFNDNRAVVGSGHHGGAIAVEDGALKLAADTIDRNTAGGTGGGIYTDSGTSISIRTTILSQNVTTGPNTPPTPTVVNCQFNGTTTDQGYNLEYSAGAADTCGFSTASPYFDVLGQDPLLTLGSYGGPSVGAASSGITFLPFSTVPLLTERPGLGSPAIDKVPAIACLDANGAPLTVDERGFARPYGTGCEIGAFEVGLLGASCSAAITFFSGGTAFALRTGDQTRAPLMSYLSIKGPAGTITAVPLVPRAGVPDTITCIVPDPEATPLATTTTFSVDAQVVISTQPGVPRGTVLRITAIRTATTESVTVSLVNPDNSTGATLYAFTPSVAPQSFRISASPLPSIIL